MTNKPEFENLGPFFRKMRSQKGFTLKEAAGNVMSTKHLSNFENGRTDLTAHIFLEALANINLNTFEFQHAYNQYLRDKDILLFSTDISQAFLIHNTVELEHLLMKLKKNDKKSKKEKLEEIRISAVISILNDCYEFPKEHLNFIRSYFSGLKEWGYYEILLFSDCVPLFDVLSLSQFLHGIINPTQTNYNLVYVKQVRIQAVLNSIQYFIEQNQLSLADEFIGYLEHIDIHEYWTFEKIILCFNKSCLDYKRGNDDAKDDMKNCEELLKMCGCYKLANKISSKIKEITLP